MQPQLKCLNISYIYLAFFPKGPTQDSDAENKQKVKKLSTASVSFCYKITSPSQEFC